MKTRRRLPTLEAARDIRLLRDRIVPRTIGTHRGKGPHVNMPATWDGVGRVPPGWSGYMGEVEEFERDGTSAGFRLDFPDDMLELISGSSDKFTEGERLLSETEFALCDERREDGDPEPPRPKTVSDIARELKREE